MEGDAGEDGVVANGEMVEDEADEKDLAEALPRVMEE